MNTWCCKPCHSVEDRVSAHRCLGRGAAGRRWHVQTGVDALRTEQCAHGKKGGKCRLASSHARGHYPCGASETHKRVEGRASTPQGPSPGSFGLGISWVRSLPPGRPSPQGLGLSRGELGPQGGWGWCGGGGEGSVLRETEKAPQIHVRSRRFHMMPKLDPMIPNKAGMISSGGSAPAKMVVPAMSDKFIISTGRQSSSTLHICSCLR